VNDTIDKAEELLKALWTALGDEQKAVAMLDAAALERARLTKERLSAELTTLAPSALSGHADRKRVEELRALATRVTQQARANAVLLFDATELLSARLGIQPASTGTYDRSARMKSRRFSIAGRAA
jgi:hypothetical protein